MATNQSSINSNVVNLGELIQRISKFGVKYNPPRTDFSIPYLTDLKASGEIVVANSKSADNIDTNSSAARSLALKTMDGLVTRSNNSFSISGAPKQSIKQAASKVRTYRNIRVSAKPTAEQKATAKAEGKELKTNTMHNANIDKKIENVEDYIDFLKKSGIYAPNESDISIEGLTASLNDLKAKQSISSKTSSDADDARMARNILLFTDDTGLVDIAFGVKRYVKSVFGAKSIQYKQISDLKFKKFKKIVNQDTQEPQPQVG